MADTAVTSRSLTLVHGAAQSAELDSTSTAGTSVATGNTGVLTPAGGGNTRMCVFSLYGTAAATVVFKAGDEPPSELAGEGAGDSDTFTVNSGKATIVVLEAGRFVQDNGTVRALVGGTGPVIFNALTLPLGM